MDATGFIEDIGVPSATVLNPTVGLDVAKSGRTTGFTTGTVGAINASVNVQYQKNCGQGKKFVVSYTNQVVITGNTFSAGGDSGSLIVSNTGHNPVALLFAGSSTVTIGNPIGEVISKLSAVLGQSLSFVGSAGAGATKQALPTEVQPFFRGIGEQMPQLPQQAAERASAALELHRANLMSTPGVIGAGIGASQENELAAAIVVFVDRTSGAKPQFAATLEGMPVKVVFTDPFVAF